MKKQLNIKKLLLLNMPYILMGLFATNFGEAWRMAVGADASAKMLSFFSTLPVALQSFWPSLHPLDLLVGLCCGGGLRLAVYLKSKNTKKYRHGMEYATLLEQTVSPEKQREFLCAMGGQLDKLDFLMQAMIKTSRLETGVISLQAKGQPLYDTLAAALGGILLNAEKKQIEVTVDCTETVSAAHDRKWTTEALFNILDNAVKYTPEGGKIHVAVACWEMYAKIDISDTGIGIPEQHQGTIFKRFYREDSVHDAPGIGIGLYLAREIITRQAGFIRVVSEVGAGSTFSVFLPRS